METREIFEKVKQHLLRQGQRAKDPATGICRYRYGTLSCAVGCLIADPYYNAELEECVLRDGGPVLAAVEKSLGTGLTDRQVEMLRDLRHVHDKHLPDEWPAELDRIEKELP